MDVIGLREGVVAYFPITLEIGPIAVAFRQFGIGEPAHMVRIVAKIVN